MVERFFTPQAANQILPDVKRIVQEILAQASQPQISRERVMPLLVQLEDMGCYYKDWNYQIGLVDFPAIIHGQEALLCWRSDEPEVAWFHGFQDGYAGRRPITRELVFS